MKLSEFTVCVTVRKTLHIQYSSCVELEIEGVVLMLLSPVFGSFYFIVWCFWPTSALGFLLVCRGSACGSFLFFFQCARDVLVI